MLYIGKVNFRVMQLPTFVKHCCLWFKGMIAYININQKKYVPSMLWSNKEIKLMDKYWYLLKKCSHDYWSVAAGFSKKGELFCTPGILKCGAFCQ